MVRRTGHVRGAVSTELHGGMSDTHAEDRRPTTLGGWSRRIENDVAATARLTASIRARETVHPDGLFRDTLAEVQAGHEAMAAMHAMPEAKPGRRMRGNVEVSRSR